MTGVEKNFLKLTLDKSHFITEKYIYKNFTELGQKIFTQRDLDNFLEYITTERKSDLPEKLQEHISDSSLKKVRNMLYKNIEAFGWGSTENSKLIVRRPSLTPEWFTFLLYYRRKYICNTAHR